MIKRGQKKLTQRPVLPNRIRCLSLIPRPARSSPVPLVPLVRDLLAFELAVKRSCERRQAQVGSSAGCSVVDVGGVFVR